MVDCGFTKQRHLNPSSGQEALIVSPEAQANARQRAGRAGRVRAGAVYVLMTEASFHALPAQAEPEMHRPNMATALIWKVRRAMHGLRRLQPSEVDDAYAQMTVDLRDSRCGPCPYEEGVCADDGVDLRDSRRALPLRTAP